MANLKNNTTHQTIHFYPGTKEQGKILLPPQKVTVIEDKKVLEDPYIQGLIAAGTLTEVVSAPIADEKAEDKGKDKGKGK